MNLGLSKITMPVIIDGSYSKKYIVDFVPLTQKEIANGWKQKMPKCNKKSTQHHFSISLDELPFNLWNKINKYDSNDDYYIVKNNIYIYSIAKTEYDNLLFDLYTEVIKYVPNINIIKQLYDELKTKFDGWLIIKAEQIINNTLCFD